MPTDHRREKGDVDWLQELAIISLLDSVDRTKRTGLNRHAAAAARRRLKATPPAARQADKVRQRLQDGLKTRLEELRRRQEMWADHERAVGPPARMDKGQNK
jgi:hypothetical protein